MSLDNARVLVIGGLGFIGGNVTDRLLRLNAKVTILTPMRNHHASRADALERRGATVVEGDLRNLPLLRKLVTGQTAIANLAGQSGAARSMEDPWTDLDVNLRGTLVVLEAIRECNRDALYVCAGSRLEYGRLPSLPATEGMSGEALSLYAIHKRTIEQYLRLYAELYGIRFAIARVTNPYGPGQPRGRTAYGVVNRLIQLAVAGGTLPVFGDGTQKRDYIHVDDVVSAIIRLMETPAAAGRVYNIASGTGTRLIDLAQRVIELAGGGRVEFVEWPPLVQRLEAGDFIADITRARDELGWSPAIGLDEGLSQTVEHYKTIER